MQLRHSLVSTQIIRDYKKGEEIIMRRTCRGCGSNNLHEIIDFGNMPLAGGFLANEEAVAKEKYYPLKIHVCADCVLLQILNPIDPEILFQDYSFSSSTIKPLIDHFEAYARWLIEKIKPKKVMEFGCNDGILLAPLRSQGVKAVGVDVSRNITEMARNKGLDVVTGYFNQETADQIRSRIGEVDVVTGSNAFAHNDKPEVILNAANHILTKDGFLCLEVMYAGDLLETLQWDTFYHEHLTFYSLSSLRVLLERYGFYVVEAERVPMHGGSLRICAGRNASLSKQAGVNSILEYENEKGLTKVETWQNFADLSRRKIEIVKNVYRELSRNYKIWAYGAAGKATMWVNVCGMDYLGGVVDASPLRAGKMMPGTHTPIVFPAEFKKNPPDYMFVTAWNYAEQIRAKELWFQGVWSVPLPELKFF